MNKKLITGIIVILLLETAVISSNGRATQEKSSLPVLELDGTILYVGGTGPNNYTTIQDAVDDAGDGDTIYVFDDSSPYYENVVVDKSINLIGTDKHTTIIDGSGSGNVVNISADYVTIEGFTIQNAGDTYLLNWVHPSIGLYVFADAGVYVLSDYNHIQGNIIKDNPIHGVHIHDNSDHNVISDNVVTNISDPTASVGIFLQFSSHNVISGNTIINNSKHGIHLLWGCNDNTISDNTITNNNCALEISGNWASIDNVITRNTIINNRNLGVYLYIQCFNTVISENVIINNNMVGLVLQQTCSGSSISNNTIANHDLGIIVEIFVDDVTISDNVITNHSENGIEIVNCADNCIITGNTIVNNNNGIYMREADNNIFYENIFTDNQRGIDSRATSGNLFHHNNFIDNGENIYDAGTNTWEYNYYDDYTGEDFDNDGIGDTPYDIPGGSNQDHYPLMYPWSGVSGDLDGDGDVDLSDLAQLLANYGTTEGATYEDGDIDGDGDIDLNDLAALLANYGYGL